MNLPPNVQNRKLKNYSIAPNFQLKFIGLIVLTNVLIAGLIVGVAIIYFKNSPTLFGVMQYMHNDTSLSFRQELNDFARVLVGILIFSFVLIAATAWVLSHRIAGAMYRFKMTFDDIASGNLSARIFLRSTDSFQDVADSFNNMMNKLTSKKDRTP